MSCPVPVEVRLTLLGLLGATLGSLVNLGVYRLAWNQRSISPWSAPDAAAPPRRWTDCLPIVGWFGLRRERTLHGTGFWVRPLVVESLMAFGLPALYWWEVIQYRLLPTPVVTLGAQPMGTLHVQYGLHVILLSLLLLASLIDFDEKTIPDAVTLPGALIGLMAAACYPMALLPAGVQWAGQGPVVEPLTLATPLPYPEALLGVPHPWSLVLALGCWWAWCVALMPRTWYTRHGWGRAIGLSWARMRRERVTRGLALLGLAGSAGIVGMWFLGGLHWVGLLTAVVGLAAGGAIVWIVRNVGTAVLGREAMGFGDVTLMAMIGTFMGWQSCLLIFFLAPLAGLVMGVLVLLTRRETEIPYGPFLCLAALGALLFWPGLWNWARPIFALGSYLAAVLAVCVVVLAVMLGLVQLLKRAFR
jgi:prepilin signal peptidase PulO-like enzyme (type II secretory pathway)